MQARPVLAALAELAIIGGASLLALFWLVPTQTTADPFAALQPGLVPNVCAAAILALIIFQAWNAIRKGSSGESRGEGEDAAQEEHSWRSALGAIAIVVAGVLAWHLGGLLAIALVIVPGLMLFLGERRPLRIALISACCALPFTPLFS